MQSLLDKMPGQKVSTDEFLSDSIESKYYTPVQFISEKFSKKTFTIIHLNVASLQCHIDELTTLLSLVAHPFDVICVTETRLYAKNSLSNISIEGYDFLHTRIYSQCGGAGIYIKNYFEYKRLDKYLVSHHNISESTYIEIENVSKNNIAFGCIYRNHTPISDFQSVFLNDILKNIIKSK